MSKKKKPSKSAAIATATAVFDAVVPMPSTELATVDKNAIRQVETKDIVNTEISLKVGIDEMAAAHRVTAAAALKAPFETAKRNLADARDELHEREGEYNTAVNEIKHKAPDNINTFVESLVTATGVQPNVVIKAGAVNQLRGTYKTHISVGVDALDKVGNRPSQPNSRHAYSDDDCDDDDVRDVGDVTAYPESEITISNSLTFTVTSKLPESVTEAMLAVRAAASQVKAAEYMVNELATRISEINNDVEGSKAKLTLRALNRTTLGSSVLNDLAVSVESDTQRTLADIVAGAAAIAKKGVALAVPVAKKSKK